MENIKGQITDVSVKKIASGQNEGQEYVEFKVGNLTVRAWPEQADQFDLIRATEGGWANVGCELKPGTFKGKSFTRRDLVSFTPTETPPDAPRIDEKGLVSWNQRLKTDDEWAREFWVLRWVDVFTACARTSDVDTAIKEANRIVAMLKGTDDAV